MIFYDFYYNYAAGRMLLRGENPYDLTAFAAELHACGWPATEFPNGFFYFPWTMYLFAPFALLPFWLAVGVWTALTLVTVHFVVRDLLSMCPVLRSLSPPRRMALLLLFMPLMKHLLFANNAFVAFGGFYLAMSLFRRHRWFASGLALSIVTMKPHLLLPLEVAVCILALRRERLSFFLGGAIGVAAQLALSLLFAPQSVHFFLERGDSWNRSQLSPTASMVRILSSHLDLPGVATCAVLAAVALGVVIARREPQRVPELYLLFIPLSLCLTPYSWSHDFLFLLPAHLFLLEFGMNRFGAPVVFGASILMCIGSMYFLTAPLLEQFLFVYSPLYLGLGLLLSGRMTSPSTSI